MPTKHSTAVNVFFAKSNDRHRWIAWRISGAAEILAQLPHSFPLPIAVVLHRHRDSHDMLAPTLQRESLLPVSEVADKDPIRGGRVYLCPPDYHLPIDRDSFALSTHDPVNFARPSIDVLFESAAESKRAAVIAVVLTGAGSDGAQDARRVEACGGTVLVQDPKTAEGPWMPTAAIASTRSPQVLSLNGIAADLSAQARHPH